MKALIWVALVVFLVGCDAATMPFTTGSNLEKRGAIAEAVMHYEEAAKVESDLGRQARERLVALKAKVEQEQAEREKAEAEAKLNIAKPSGFCANVDGLFLPFEEDARWALELTPRIKRLSSPNEMRLMIDELRHIRDEVRAKAENYRVLNARLLALEIQSGEEELRADIAKLYAGTAAMFDRIAGMFGDIKPALTAVVYITEELPQIHDHRHPLEEVIAEACKKLETTTPIAVPPSIQETVDAWVHAQKARDFEAYSLLYDIEFQGVKRAGDKARSYDRTTWLADRKGMFVSGFTVVVGSLQIMRADDNEATVRFEQVWASTKFSDVGMKEMVLRRNGDAWLIIFEEQLNSKVVRREN